MMSESTFKTASRKMAKRRGFWYTLGIAKNVEDLKKEEALRLIPACTRYPEIEQLHYLKKEFREFFNVRRIGEMKCQMIT